MKLLKEFAIGAFVIIGLPIWLPLFAVFVIVNCLIGIGRIVSEQFTE